MKKLLKTLSVIGLVILLFSCSDILDNVKPSESITPEQALGNEGAIESIRASMYGRLHSFAYTTLYRLGPSALADGLVNRESTTRFAGLVTNGRGAGMGSWATSYNLINDANLIINSIKEGVLDQATLDQYRGEAFFFRAFAMHYLVKAYGYDPNMTPNTGDGADFNLGVVIRTQPTMIEVDASYKPRSTVAEVYDLIISDLNQAITLLSNGDEGSPVYVTLAAAEALMARVQLYSQNYDLANQYATDALDHTAATLVQPNGVATMFDETVSLNPGALFVITVDPNTESLGVNNSLTAYTAQQYVALVPTQDLMDLYSNSDARLAWFSPCFDEYNGSAETGCHAAHPAIANGQEELELSKWSGEQGQYADDIPIFRIPEMLLIQAEARVKGAGGDPLVPLNELRAARGLSPYTGTDIMQAILDARRREFIGEGQRFWDLKRLGQTIRKAPETINVEIANVPYSDYRVLANIPNAQVTLSEQNAPQDSVLIQNPGY